MLQVTTRLLEGMIVCKDIWWQLLFFKSSMGLLICTVEIWKKVTAFYFCRFCKDFPLYIPSYTNFPCSSSFIDIHWFNIASSSADFHKDDRVLPYSIYQSCSICILLFIPAYTAYLCRITPINSAITRLLISSLVDEYLLLCQSRASSIQTQQGCSSMVDINKFPPWFGTCVRS